MEEIYTSIARIAFGIITLTGILWSGISYMIKYRTQKYMIELRTYVDERVDTILDRIKANENSIWELNRRVTQDVYAIRKLTNEFEEMHSNDTIENNEHQPVK